MKKVSNKENSFPLFFLLHISLKNQYLEVYTSLFSYDNRI